VGVQGQFEPHGVIQLCARSFLAVLVLPNWLWSGQSGRLFAPGPSIDQPPKPLPEPQRALAAMSAANRHRHATRFTCSIALLNPGLAFSALSNAEKSSARRERDPEHGPADPGGDRAGPCSPWPLPATGRQAMRRADSHLPPTKPPCARRPNAASSCSMVQDRHALRWICQRSRKKARHFIWECSRAWLR